MASGTTAMDRRRARSYPSLVVQQLHTMEQEYGGRQGLVGALMLAPMTPDLEYLVGQLGDPRNGTASLAAICARANVLPGHLLHLLMEGGRLVARARAAHLVHGGIAPVIQDILRRAAPYEEACIDCMVEGVSTGTITAEPTPTVPNPVPHPCPVCKGALKLLHLPELSRQELALELGQLLPKGGGINIALQQNNHGGGRDHTKTLDLVQQLAEEALYEDQPGPAPVTEGEVVDLAEPAQS